MFTSHKQISPPSLVLKLKISEVSQKWIPKAVELKRIPTHKKCKCKKFCSQTRLVGEIYSSDVIMHRGYCINGKPILTAKPWKVDKICGKKGEKRRQPRLQGYLASYGAGERWVAENSGNEGEQKSFNKSVTSC